MAKVRIGITTTPDVLRDIAVEALNRSFVDAVVRAGAVPVVLPVLSPDDVDDVLVGLDGVLLSGGGDVDPSLYGQLRQLEVSGVDRARDEFEIALARAAVARGLPLLGICRGMQVLNVAFGGTLVQHLSDGAHAHKERASEVFHGVDVAPSSQVASVLGMTEVGVNTLHHQAVDELGEGLRAVAWSDDAVIEAVESTGGEPILGVQWHPELLVDGPGGPELFAWLVATASSAGLASVPEPTDLAEVAATVAVDPTVDDGGERTSAVA